VAYFSHPTAMRGDIETKNRFSLKRKVPFITARFESNFYCIYRMRRECYVGYFSHPTAMRGEIGRKTGSPSRVKCPSLHIDFNPTCTARNAWAGSAICHISVIPLQCQGRYRRKTVSTSIVKCPSSLTALNVPTLKLRKLNIQHLAAFRYLCVTAVRPTHQVCQYNYPTNSRHGTQNI
jgi:hypothetical protein